MSAAPVQPSNANAAPAAGPRTLRLKKGQILFSEGENSKAMYLLKSGRIRIFKKKGSAFIEIDTIHPGAILGELAFLDGLPRSASGEALVDCELTEISGPTFTQTMAKMPEWLKTLLKTVVGRLRAASNRIRQLETASTALDYSAKDGKGSSVYQYLIPSEILKTLSAVLLVGARNGSPTEKGLKVTLNAITKYANQVMQVPTAKITSILDLMAQCGIFSAQDLANMGDELTVTDIDFLEKFIAYYNEQNLLEPSKRSDLTVRGFLVLSLLMKYFSTGKKDEKSGQVILNVADIKNAEQAAIKREPFRIEECDELVKLGLVGQLTLKSGSEAYTAVDPQKFSLMYRIHRMIKLIESINEQKRLGSR